MQRTREHYHFGTATIDVSNNRVKTVTARTIHIFSQNESLGQLFWDYDLFEFYQDCTGEDACDWIDSLADCARAIDAYNAREAA